MVYYKYNPNAETTFNVNGNPFSLGAILSPKTDSICPVAYANKTINDVERTYSKTVGEPLAVARAVEKFKTYVYL